MNNQKTGINYRKAEPKDFALVAKLAEQTFRESWTEDGNEADIDQYVNENFTKEKIAAELSDNNISFLLAFEDEQPVAYVKLKRNLQPDNHQLEKPVSVSRVYVRKPFQGKQIGTKLLEQAESLTRKENFKTLWLGVWNENLGALRLYKRFGFEQFGIYKFIMGTVSSDDFLMMKKL